MQRTTQCAADMGQMSHAPQAEQAQKMHRSTVLRDGGADGDTRLEQHPARPAADRELGHRLPESKTPEARTQQTESILCRNLAQETQQPESGTSRPVPASRAAGTEDHLNERNVLSSSVMKIPTSLEGSGDQAIASGRTETWDRNKERNLCPT